MGSRSYCLLLLSVTMDWDQVRLRSPTALATLRTHRARLPLNTFLALPVSCGRITDILGPLSSSPFESFPSSMVGLGKGLNFPVPGPNACTSPVVPGKVARGQKTHGTTLHSEYVRSGSIRPLFPNCQKPFDGSPSGGSVKGG